MELAPSGRVRFYLARAGVKRHDRRATTKPVGSPQGPADLPARRSPVPYATESSGGEQVLLSPVHQRRVCALFEPSFPPDAQRKCHRYSPAPSRTALGQRAGDYFVVAKNIEDPLDTEQRWRQQLDKPVFDAYMMAAETLKSRLTRESYVEIHDVLDELIAEHRPEWLSSPANLAGYHQYHSQLDHYMRSHKNGFGRDCASRVPTSHLRARLGPDRRGGARLSHVRVGPEHGE